MKGKQSQDVPGPGETQSGFTNMYKDGFWKVISLTEICKKFLVARLRVDTKNGLGLQVEQKYLLIYILLYINVLRKWIPLLSDISCSVNKLTEW